MLIDIVSNLKIEDATQTTKIIDGVSAIYSTLNQVKVELKNRKKELSRSEGAAQFNAQLKLLNQAVINYLDLCQSPDKCDEFLTKTMIQLEELEGKFSEFDEYVEQLTTKREEIYSAFESRKQSLLEARNRRAGSLTKSAERVLNGISHRLEGFSTINEINGYLASDLMIEKVRDIIDQLRGLGDSVKADDIQTRLKTLREDAVRQLKDRKELFEDGSNVIRLGKHRFSVNHQELELSIVPRDGAMFFHLAGTDFFEEITDETFLDTRDVWTQEVVSENDDVYRCEFLTWKIVRTLESAASTGRADALLGADSIETFSALPESDQLEAIQRFMGPRYSEGYTKGVHDRDCALLLDALLAHPSCVRALAAWPGNTGMRSAILGAMERQERERNIVSQAQIVRSRPGILPWRRGRSSVHHRNCRGNRRLPGREAAVAICAGNSRPGREIPVQSVDHQRTTCGLAGSRGGHQSFQNRPYGKAAREKV